jgi:hypothetical protein
MGFGMNCRPFAVKALVFAVCFAIGPATAQENTEETASNNWGDTTRLTQLSCDTLVVADYKAVTPKSSSLASGVPEYVDVDLTKCQKNLKPQTLESALRPLLEEFDAQVATPEDNPSEDTESERKARIAKRDADNKRISLAVKANFEPFVKSCRNIQPKPKNGVHRVCYFGAFNPEAGNPARAAFRAMAENRLQEPEAVCTADPLRRDKRTEPEFQEFITYPDLTLAWKIVRASLARDGFSCESDEDSDGCGRMVLGIHLNMVGEGTDADNTTLFGNDGVVPRFLRVYNGKWYVLGPYGGVSCEKGKDESTARCVDSEPLRGTKDGICMVPEDWHIFGHLVFFLNTKQ